MNNFTKSIVYSGVVLAAGLVAIFAIYNNIGNPNAGIEPASGDPSITESYQPYSENQQSVTSDEVASPADAAEAATDAATDAAEGAEEAADAAAKAAEAAKNAEAAADAAAEASSNAAAAASDATEAAESTPAATEPSAGTEEAPAQ